MQKMVVVLIWASGTCIEVSNENSAVISTFFASFFAPEI